MPPHLRNGQVSTSQPQQQQQQHQHQQMPSTTQPPQQNFNNAYNHAPPNAGMQGQNGAGAPYYNTSNY